MHVRSRVAAAAVSTLLGLAVATTAGANRLEVSEQRFIFTWSTTRPLSLSAGSFSAVCAVQMRGRFSSRTISKVESLIIGDIEAAARTSCSTLEMFFLNGSERLPGERTPVANTLPWSIVYKSFSGSLPNISSVKIAIPEVSVLVSTLFGSCLYRGTGGHPLRVDLQISSSQVVAAVVERGTILPRSSGGGMCPGEVSVTGEAGVTNEAGSASISMRLV